MGTSHCNKQKLMTVLQDGRCSHDVDSYYILRFTSSLEIANRRVLVISFILVCMSDEMYTAIGLLGT